MVYIAPRSSTIGMTTPPCRNPLGASRKTLEIFDDRIFHSATDANQPSTPTQNLRSLKSFHALSAPAATRRNYKTVQDASIGTWLARRADEQEESFTSKLIHASRGMHAHNARTLRRRQTCQDLRSSDSILKSERSFEKPSLPLNKLKGYPKLKDGTSQAVPLSSRTNQIERHPTDHLPHNVTKKAIILDVASVENPVHESSVVVTQQGPEKPKYEDISFGETGFHQNLRSSSHDIDMPDVGDFSRWDLRNVNDYIGCWQDFQKPCTRSDTTPAKDLNPHVKRIDVTTTWNGLSSVAAEELFHIHLIFRDALKFLCSSEVQDMLPLIKKNFFSKEGNFASLEGFRVAVLDRWVRIDREQLISEMTTRGHDFFSQMEHQPNRSALMQLYLSSTECFLDWGKYGEGCPSSNAGVSMRTFYDQLSDFEVPTARAASFGDYVRFLNLNPTPREDEELTIIPQYNRDGIFVQTPYPDDVEYHMETPVTWLGWDDNIKGFRGRVPTYSAFSDTFEFDRDMNEDGCVSHVLDITLAATFQKSCTTGPAHFKRVVRMRLTFYILPKHPSSVEHSVYGAEQRQQSALSYRDRFSKLPSSASSSHEKSSQNKILLSNKGDKEKRAEDYFVIPKRPVEHLSLRLEAEERKMRNANFGNQGSTQKNSTCPKQTIHYQEESQLWKPENAEDQVKKAQLGDTYRKAGRWEPGATRKHMAREEAESTSCPSDAADETIDVASVHLDAENESEVQKLVEPTSSVDEDFAMQEAIRKSLQEGISQTEGLKKWDLSEDSFNGWSKAQTCTAKFAAASDRMFGPSFAPDVDSSSEPESDVCDWRVNFE